MVVARLTAVALFAAALGLATAVVIRRLIPTLVVLAVGFIGTRIVTTFGSGADTVGVSFEREPGEANPASAGWYNNRAFENRARAAGAKAVTIAASARLPLRSSTDDGRTAKPRKAAANATVSAPAALHCNGTDTMAG